MNDDKEKKNIIAIMVEIIVLFRHKETTNLGKLLFEREIESKFPYGSVKCYNDSPITNVIKISNHIFLSKIDYVDEDKDILINYFPENTFINIDCK